MPAGLLLLLLCHALPLLASTTVLLSRPGRPAKRHRSITRYSDLYRRPAGAQFTPAPRNNGHGGPTVGPQLERHGGEHSLARPGNTSQAELAATVDRLVQLLSGQDRITAAVWNNRYSSSSRQPGLPTTPAWPYNPFQYQSTPDRPQNQETSRQPGVTTSRLNYYQTPTTTTTRVVPQYQITTTTRPYNPFQYLRTTTTATTTSRAQYRPAVSSSKPQYYRPRPSRPPDTSYYPVPAPRPGTTAAPATQITTWSSTLQTSRPAWDYSDYSGLDYSVDYSTNFITGPNVLPEMGPGRPSHFITGSNVIPEMGPPPRPVTRPAPATSLRPPTTIRPAITFEVGSSAAPTRPARPSYSTQTFRPIHILLTTKQTTTTTTQSSRPLYTGPPTYKPTYKPGVHLTPARPAPPTRPLVTRPTPTAIYKPTFKPAVLATFRPTLGWVEPVESSSSSSVTLPTYPFPILPEFDPVTAATPATSTASPATPQPGVVTIRTTQPAAVTIAGLEGVGIPASPAAALHYLTVMVDQIRALLAPALQLAGEQYSQADEHSLAMAATVVGLPLTTGLLSALGAGPAIVIALAWLAPLALLLTVPGVAKWV